MKKRGMVAVVLVAVLVLGAATRTSAFLGFGDIVFDPSVYAQFAEQLIRMEQQYEQLVRSYDMLHSQYSQMLRNARMVPVNMMSRYKAIATNWRPSTATDTYGVTAPWTHTVNMGSAWEAGYTSMTERLGVYGAALNTVPAAQRSRLIRDYAAIELSDGANISALRTIGRLRENGGPNQDTIDQLETDSLSSDPAMNTEVAVLNKINAASIIGLRSSQDTNKLLIALAERELLQATFEREARTRAINDHIRFTAEGRGIATAQSAGASQAMLDWRLP